MKHIRPLGRGFVLALGLVIAAALPAAADSDHERARAAVEAGQIVPLSRALAKVESLYRGEVLEVELEDDDHGDGKGGRSFMYEIKLLTPRGDVLELKLDAKTLDVVKVEGRGAERARRE